MEDLTVWPEWTDPLGQVYRPGDYVAVAVINGRSPQMVFGRVLQINRVDSKGRTLWEDYWPEGAPHYYKDRQKRSSCTVKVQPLLDGRGFHRYSDKAVTYRFPGNIVKVPEMETNG